MEKLSSRLRAPGLLAAAFAVLMLSVCALACPATASAEEAKQMAHAKDDSVIFYTAEEAVAYSAEHDGATVVMDEDWVLAGHIEVPEEKKVTIDMYGHRVVGVHDTAFMVKSNGDLTLTSSKKATFTYDGYSGQDGNKGSYTTFTGGLLSEKHGTKPAINASEYATVTLDGITIAGCASSASGSGDTRDDVAGTVFLSTKVTFNMKNGASIEHNKANTGGGIYAIGSQCSINIDHSSISDNYADRMAGGLYVGGNYTVVSLTDGAHISNNSADVGGGVALCWTNFTLKGDGTATIDSNTARYSSRTGAKDQQSGGGIYVGSVQDVPGGGLIEGLTISNNYSDYDGGGFEIDQENVTIKNCTIKKNSCKYEGGGIYVCNDGTTIDGCTITENSCSVNSGGNYEGGGVFVWHSYDVKLNGLCTISNNYRGKDSGDIDDLFLREDFWSSAKAYITGNLAEGSSVGVRTGTTGDRRIAKKFSCPSKDGLFIDFDSYYVSYGSDDSGDAWQRNRSLAFAINVNGTQVGRYKNGERVALTAPAAAAGKAFWLWDAQNTKGLYPVYSYINNENCNISPLNLLMPQHDVFIAATYADTVKAALATIPAPVPGERLPLTAQFVRTDEGVGAQGDTFTATVTWYEFDESGNKVASGGRAWGNTKYVASISMEKVTENGLFFDDEYLKKPGALKVRTSDGNEFTPTSVSVDPSTGTLTAEVVLETGDGPAAPGKTTATVKMLNQGLIGTGDSSESAVSAVALSAEAEGQSDQSDLGTFYVSWTEGDQTVTVVAPSKSGYNFCNWEGAQEGWGKDDVKGVVTVPYDQVGMIDQLVAVYTPVATKVDIGDLKAPVAGEDLVVSVSDVKVSAPDGTDLSFAKALERDGFKVTWSPEVDEDDTAAYSTAYTALIWLCEDKGFEDVEKVLADDAVITCGGTEATSAAFTIVDDKLCLAVAFPATDDVKAVSVSQPSDVEFSFEKAKAYAELGEWPLPGTVELTLEGEDGAKIDGDITWDAVTGFNADATGAQEFQVKGTVTHIAHDYAVDTSEVSLDVSCTVKVAAPAQAGGGDHNSDAAGTNATDASKSALAKTNDSIPLFAVAAVALVAVAAIAVAVVAAMRRRKG